MAKTTIIGLKELREKTQKYISRVKKGESFMVVKRSEAIFKISPPDEDEELWETVIDFTEDGKKRGITAENLLKLLKNG